MSMCHLVIEIYCAVFLIAQSTADDATLMIDIKTSRFSNAQNKNEK